MVVLPRKAPTIAAPPLTLMEYSVNIKHFALGLVFLASPLAYSTDANAGDEYASCAHKKDDDKRAKCNKNHAKYLKKNKGKTDPMVPSAITDKLSSYDAADKNIFATDDWYFGTVTTGIKSLDELTGEVYKATGAIKMARYAGYLNQNGNKEEAVAVAQAVLPELVALKDIVPTMQEKVAAVKAEITADPKLALKAKPALNVLTVLPKLPADLAGAIKAAGPLAKGAAGAAVDQAVDTVKDAAGQ
jgi:hypothetical protein